MSEREKILILFEGAHIAYSPTIAQLYGELEKNFEVTIFTQDPKDFTTDYTVPYRLALYKPPRRFSKLFYWLLFQTVALFNTEARKINKHLTGKHVDYFFRYLKIKEYIQQKKFDKIICVDLKNLFFVNYMLKTSSYFLSLELCRDEKVLPLIDVNLVDCVIIQSKIRYDYLFKDKQLQAFYIPNAPTFNRQLIKAKRAGLIYTGTAWDPFGFGYCLNYLKENPTEQVVVLGAVKDKLIKKNEAYQQLILNNRLLISDKYIPDADVVEFISGYEIGFCLYNFDYAWINNFNYLSAPSGKVFKYLAAGIPVICNKIPGFAFVDEFACGVQIEKFDPGTIQAAIDKIRNNYAQYVQGAVTAAEHFSFDKAVQPFMDFAKTDI